MNLPLGAIKPEGWTRRQLEIQAAGLSGHLDEFWPDVRDSGWIGGSAEGWERAPYWLDGFVPLAFLLEDDELIRKADRWIGYIIEHQHEDGWLGPAGSWRGFDGVRDPWPLFVILKVLVQYAEVRGEHGPGARTYDTIVSTLRAIAAHIDMVPLFAWNQYRWGDLLVVVIWCREREPADWLDVLAERIHNQGYDWLSHFRRFPFTGKSDRWTYDRHVVNNAMGIKVPGLWEYYTTGHLSPETVLEAVQKLDEHHGQSTGVFSGDECFAGRMPSQGTELCAVVEYLYSLEQVLQYQSDVRISDRLERIAFSALPATFSPDMWAHQYDQQVNQVSCVVLEDHLYTTNDGDANIYGLEPNFGCCTANMHQGFPKLVSSLWVPNGAGGFRAVSYLPCSVRVQSPAGRLTLRVSGTYPLDGVIGIKVIGDDRMDRPVPIDLPIPGWARGATLSIDEAPPVPLKPATVERVTRDWKGTHEIVLRLPMFVRVEFRSNGAASVYRGPMLYALQPEEAWTHLRGQVPHADYEVRAASDWNLAIGLAAGDPDFGLVAEPVAVHEPALTTLTAASSAPAPSVLSQSAAARRIAAESASRTGGPDDHRARMWRVPVPVARCPDWSLEHGAAAPPPESPVRVDGAEGIAYLVPYAGTGLRIAEIPWFWTDSEQG